MTNAHSPTDERATGGDGGGFAWRDIVGTPTAVPWASAMQGSFSYNTEEANLVGASLRAADQDGGECTTRNGARRYDAARTLTTASSIRKAR